MALTMTDSDRHHLLFGPCRTPVFRYGVVVPCELRGQVPLRGLSANDHIGRSAPLRARCFGVSDRSELAVSTLPPATLQSLRAIEVLERIGTPDAAYAG